MGLTETEETKESEGYFFPVLLVQQQLPLGCIGSLGFFGFPSDSPKTSTRSDPSAILPP